MVRNEVQYLVCSVQCSLVISELKAFLGFMQKLRYLSRPLYLLAGGFLEHAKTSITGAQRQTLGSQLIGIDKMLVVIGPLGFSKQVMVLFVEVSLFNHNQL